MMADRSIWKFPLNDRLNVVTMPVGAEVLAVREQRGVPCLWAIVDPTAPTEARTFMVEITGGVLRSTSTVATYVGTCQVEGAGPWSEFVLLVFEAVERPSRLDRLELLRRRIDAALAPWESDGVGGIDGRTTQDVTRDVVDAMIEFEGENDMARDTQDAFIETKGDG